MISTEPYFYAGYTVAIVVYVLYALSLHLRRRSIRDRIEPR
jgi:hypothetical protein